MTVQATGDTGAAAQSISLEIIVKFTGDSDPGRRVGRTLREHPTDLSGLARLQTQLHRSIGIALETERITSGAELIFRVPEEPLLEAVKQTAIGTRQYPAPDSWRFNMKIRACRKRGCCCIFEKQAKKPRFWRKPLASLPTGSACKRWRRGSAVPAVFQYGASRKRNPRWP